MTFLKLNCNKNARESPLKQDNEFEKMNSSEIFGGHFTLENEVNTTTTTGFLGGLIRCDTPAPDQRY